ncbi:hypothetical protein PYW08_006508 [Mythimna loreyi]|uniref:Uncharacterized protein n=1 Tax=Mythimna loreyi TaxID=667449 RepID=A0ACC2QNE8_9NEOP|nr:hypothetical protein PYW08_006508 [Mythimna loreyi]
MYKLFICLLLISFCVLCYSEDSILDGTELELTFLVHRHGDRTPVVTTLSQSNDPEALIKASAKYGFGQLTDAGKRRGYALGQFIRRRYDGLLSSTYNKSEIYIRSTDSTRAKMTVLAAMAAVYPGDQDRWSDHVNWTPVPYTTVPAKYDFNLAITNCPNLLSSFTSLYDLTDPFPSLDQYTDALNQWSEVVGFDISEQPMYAYTLNDIYTAQMSLGIPLDPKLQDIYPEIEEIAGIAIDYIFGTKDRGTLLAGVLLNQFLKVADQVIAGEDVPRVQVYSAHDINVFSFQVVTQITPRQGVPKYGSAYALELRKVVATGEYIVVPVYLNTPSEDVVTYLQVAGCDQRCNIESFRSITAPFSLEEAEWRTKCGFSEDMNIDTSSVD